MSFERDQDEREDEEIRKAFAEKEASRRNHQLPRVVELVAAGRGGGGTVAAQEGNGNARELPARRGRKARRG